MVPAKSHPRFRQLVTGEYQHAFKSIATSMLVSLHVRRVAMAHQSPESITAAIDEISAFFIKYEHLVIDDLNVIFG